MISDKVIFQYGNANEPNYIFYKQKFKGQLNNGVKEQRSESSLMDGSQRLNGSERNKRSGYLFNYEFANPFFSIFNTDFVNRVFYDVPKLTFWYQVADFDTDNPELIRTPAKWFYNIADCTIPPSITENERRNNSTPDSLYNIGLTLEKPFLYDCTADLQYVDLANYINTLTRYGTAIYGTSAYGSSFAPQDISGLTEEQINAFFVELNMRSINYFVYLRDRFFLRDTAQTNRNYVLEETLAASGYTDTLLTNAFRDSPTDNQIYRFEISQLVVGQSITVQNLTNSSGIRINWLDASASPTNLVFNSYYGKLYSGSSETEVDTSKYSIDVIDDKALYFSGLLNPRPFEAIVNETVRITNNVASTPTFKIDALITY